MRTVLFLALSTVWSVLTTDAKVVTAAEDSDVEKGDCTLRLKAQIQTCLLRFQGLLIVYQKPETSETQRHDMLTDMCHQYEQTLQCLHLSLLHCVADEASLQVIALRLGPVRTFMEVTCYITPRRVTQTPRTPPVTPPASLSTSTTETTVKTTASSTTSTEVAIDDSTTTTTTMTESTTPIESTTTHNPTTRLKKAQTVSTTIPPTTPVNNIKSDLPTNSKELLGAKTEQSVVENLALTDSIGCADISSSEQRLLCLQQQPTINAAVNVCRYTAVHLGALLAGVMTTVFLQ